MTSLAHISSTGRSEELPSPRLEVKSSWETGGPDASGAATSDVVLTSEQPLHEQAPPIVQQTLTRSTPAAQSIELEMLYSRAELVKNDGLRDQPPSVMHAFEPEPPADLQPHANGVAPGVVRVDGGGGGGAVVEANEERPLSVWRKLCYAMGAIPFTLTQAAMGFYFTVFLLEVVKVCVCVCAQQADHLLPLEADSIQLV